MLTELERAASRNSMVMSWGMMTPVSCWMESMASSSLSRSASVAVGGYFPSPVGEPNFSAKIIQNLIAFFLNQTGQ